MRTSITNKTAIDQLGSLRVVRLCIKPHGTHNTVIFPAGTTFGPGVCVVYNPELCGGWIPSTHVTLVSYNNYPIEGDECHLQITTPWNLQNLNLL